MPLYARSRNGAAMLVAAMTLLALPAALRAQDSPPARIAVIDVGRILEESNDGKTAIEELKKLQDQKQQEGEGLQAEAKALQDQIKAGQLSLSQEKLDGIKKDLEQKLIALQRFQDDSNRDLEAVRRRQLERIERKVMPLIQKVGVEFGYTAIFNKFQSGLVYAQDEVDITDLILTRYNALGDGGS